MCMVVVTAITNVVFDCEQESIGPRLEFTHRRRECDVEEEEDNEEFTRERQDCILSRE
jgi:hypothetical protein